MVLSLVLTVLLFALSFIAGMLGLGVAFIATPVLGLFGFDLKHVIMPWSLWLNGLTAISGAVAFARARMVDWRIAIPLVVMTTLAAPIGVWILQFVPTATVWWIYVGVLFFLAYRMWSPPARQDSDDPSISDLRRAVATLASFAIGIFAGFLGVGPGFLLMPTLVFVGYTARVAAATNSVAVTLPSFSAFASHLATAQFDWALIVLTSVAAVLGAQLGATFTARRVRSHTLARVFAIALLALAIQRVYVLLTG
jgi:uncharacterized membrane protein YfcA